MKIYKIYPRGFGANSYILTQDNRRAIVIDPAQPRIADEMDRLNLQAEYVLLTHCHFDHVGGVARLQARGAKVVCLEEEKPLVGTVADLFSVFGAEREEYKVDETVKDGEIREFCDISVKALRTAGHTTGSVCYEILEKDGGRYLFTGDTLFQDSVGRVDFPTGNGAQLQESLRKLCALSGDYVVHSGHGEETTLNTERKHNPFLE